MSRTSCFRTSSPEIQIAGEGSRATAPERFALLLVMAILGLAWPYLAPDVRAKTVRVLALGDSLTAGYGLSEPEAFPARLEAVLKARGHDVTVTNAGVSGDTSRGGLERLEWSLAEKPDAVILELGANDALRGIPPAETRSNLTAMLRSLRERGIPVLLVGMRAPPNLGEAYGAEFDSIYPDLARQFGVPLYPFFLDGVAADPALNQDDGMHPNARGVERIVERMVEAVSQLLDRLHD